MDKRFILKNQNWILPTCDSFPLIVSYLMQKYINGLTKWARLVIIVNRLNWVLILVISYSYQYDLLLENNKVRSSIDTQKQWRNFCSRVPVGKGWLGAPLIKKRLCKVQKIEACNTREPCSVGSTGPLKGPGGVQGQSPWWRSRKRSPGSSCAFQCRYSISNANSHASDC